MKFFDPAKLIGFFNRLSKREKIIFSLTAAVVGTLVLDQLLFRPIVHTFRSFNLQAQDLKSNIRKSMRLLSQKDRMMKDVTEFASYSTESKTPEEETLALLKHIEELANKSSVNLLYVKPAGAKPEGVTKKYFLTLECEGQMGQLVDFFYQIETAKFLLKIEKYALQPTSQSSSVIKCAATVSRTVVP